MRYGTLYLIAAVSVVFLAAAVSLSGRGAFSACEDYDAWQEDTGNTNVYVEGCGTLNRTRWMETAGKFGEHSDDHECWETDEYEDEFSDARRMDGWAIQFTFATVDGLSEPGFHIEDATDPHQGIGVKKNYQPKVMIHEVLHHKHPQDPTKNHNWYKSKAQVHYDQCYDHFPDDDDDDETNGNNGSGGGGGGGGGGGNNGGGGGTDCRPDVVWVPAWRSCDDSDDSDDSGGGGGTECNDDGDCAIVLPGLQACLESFHIPVEVLVCSGE